jgi:flagellar biosynthesis protein FlgN
MDGIDLFVASLDRSLQDIRDLEETMLEEMRAIESRDVDALHKIVAGKSTLVTRLEAETAQQRTWIEQAQLTFTPAGIERFIHDFDHGDQLGARWAELREAIGRCDQLNKANARLIERDRRRIAMTLRILQGEDPSSTTYDPRGRTETAGQPGRTIIRA